MTKAWAFGMPLRGFATAAAAALVTLLPASQAQALCAGLRQAMAHAAQNFEPLKIAGERGGPGAEPARTLFPDGNRCEVRGASSAVEYRCRMTRPDALPAETRATFRREVRRMRACFAGLLPRGDGDYTGAVDWTGAVIWEPRSGLRAAVVFVAAEEIALVAARGDEPPEEANAVWIVVDKRRR